MPDPARRPTAPVIAAVVAGVIAAALAVVLFAVVLPNRDSGSGSSRKSTPGDLTVRERTAMNAAATEAVNLQSLRRAQFDADWKRAVDGAIGALKQDLAGLKTKTRTTLTTNKEDLRAEVQEKALVGPTDDGKGYVVLVTINGFQIIGGKTSDPVPQRLSITMVTDKTGKWLASDVSQRGTS